MKEDLDYEMEMRGIDWIIISGPRSCNPDIVYLIGEAAVMHPCIVIQRDGGMTVVHNAMERGEIENWGLRGLDQQELVSRKEHSRLDPQDRMLVFFKRLITHFNIRGRVAFYGVNNIHSTFILLEKLFRACRQIKPVFEEKGSLFQALRLTKDSRELEILRDVAARTCQVVEKLLSRISTMSIGGDRLRGDAGQEITLGDLRTYLYMDLAEAGLTAPDIPILSSGRDAGIPHSKGDDRAPVEAGKPIILDIFPRCARTGYRCDVTRTICPGRAPERLRQIYRTVDEARKLALGGVKIGENCALVDEKVSEFFQSRGFTTLLQDDRATEGYIHSLGHGVGLDLHESPGISVFNKDNRAVRFKPGMVFTLEPGLYYPDEGIGVRLEDMVHLNENNEAEVLTPLPAELEIFPGR